MTRTVATVQAADPQALAQRAEAAGADLAELRLDGLDDVTPATCARAVEAVDRPVLATLRSADEGGDADLDEATRRDVLETVVDAGPEWIDLELGDNLIARAHDRGVRVVLSHHRHSPVDTGQLLVDLERQLALGADVAKVAMATASPDDVATLIDAARSARRRGWSYALMGLSDPVVRALAPSLGMALVYTAPSPDRAAAPGQIVTGLMEEIVDVQARTDPDRLAGVIGEDVQGSLSPPMHNAAFAAVDVPAVYLPLSVDRDAFDAVVETITELPFFGLNVTIPYKEQILDHLDRTGPVAETVGAVNTVRIEGGQVIGHNTDVAGVRRALAEVEAPDGPALVVGAGGAARAAVVALGDREIRVANRTVERAEALVDDLGGEAFPLEAEPLADAADGAAVVVNATPVSPKVPIEALADDAVVLDMVYEPRVTELLERTLAQGRTIVPGERVLLHQAAEAFEHWTRHDAPVPVMERALEVAR